MVVILKQSLSDPSKQGIHTKSCRKVNFETLKIWQTNNEIENLHQYDRIKSSLLKKYVATLRFGKTEFASLDRICDVCTVVPVI